MNQEIVKRLKELPEYRALCQYLVSEAHKLNRIDDITLTTPDEIALETIARQRAYKTLSEMLSTLLDDSQFAIMKEKDQSITTEMLQEQRSQDSNQE